MIGCFIIAIGLSLFGVARLIPNDSLFIVLSFIARMIEGFGIMSAYLYFSFMISAYFLEPASLFVAFNLGDSIADAGGPLFGGLLFDLLGYSGVFFAESITTAVCGLLALWFRKYEADHPLPPPSKNTVGFCKVLRQSVRDEF